MNMKKALHLGEHPVKIIEQGLTRALRIVGKKFEDGQFFMMDLVAAVSTLVSQDSLEVGYIESKVL